MCLSSIKDLLYSFTYDNYIFIGHSLGGVFALDLSLNFYSVNKGLIIIDTSLFASYNKSFFDTLNSNIGSVEIDSFIKQRSSFEFDDIRVINAKINSMLSYRNCSPKYFNILLENAVKFNKECLLQKINFPSMYIVRHNTNLDLAKLQIIVPSMIVRKVNSGHFVALIKNLHLETIIENFIINLQI